MHFPILCSLYKREKNKRNKLGETFDQKLLNF